MKIYDLRFTIYDSQKPRSRQTLVNRKSSIVNSPAAFTMIEIAISLAVIAFALVAIIGVLPTGLNVQKDNREDTIINQDGPYWLESIRSGAQGLGNLTNYVKKIGVVLRDLDLNNDTFTTNYDEFSDIQLSKEESGSNIVGLLSIPKWWLYSYKGSPIKYVVRVEAQTRALSGSAVEQGNANPDFAFEYLLASEIVPFWFVAPDSTNYLAHPPANSEGWITRSNRFIQIPSLTANTREFRLTFRWPLLPNDQTGPGRQSFRALASGSVATNGNLHFFQPQTFTKP